MKGTSGPAHRVSRREVLRGGLAAAAGIATIGAPAILKAKPAQLVIVSSGGKLEEAYVEAYYKPWTAKTGIEVVTGQNTYAKLKAMVEAKAVEWDVAQVDSTVAANYGRQGLLEPLDYSVIDRTDLIPGVAREHSVSSDVAGTVISWNTKLVKADAVPQTWAEFWDAGRFPGRRGMLKRADQTLEIALLADGVPFDKLYPLDLDRAFKSLDRIKPHAYWWTSGAQGAQILIDGEVSFAMEWNGRVYEPKLTGAPVDLHFNQCLFTADAWAIPKGAANKPEAMAFIAFALQPDRQAAFSRFLPYGPVNTKANALLDPQRLAVMPSSAENLKKGVFENFLWWAENGQPTVERFNQWIIG